MDFTPSSGENDLKLKLKNITKSDSQAQKSISNVTESNQSRIQNRTEETKSPNTRTPHHLHLYQHSESPKRVFSPGSFYSSPVMGTHQHQMTMKSPPIRGRIADVDHKNIHAIFPQFDRQHFSQCPTVFRHGFSFQNPSANSGTFPVQMLYRNAPVLPSINTTPSSLNIPNFASNSYLNSRVQEFETANVYQQHQHLFKPYQIELNSLLYSGSGGKQVGELSTETGRSFNQSYEMTYEQYRAALEARIVASRNVSNTKTDQKSYSYASPRSTSVSSSHLQSDSVDNSEDGVSNSTAEEVKMKENVDQNAHRNSVKRKATETTGDPEAEPKGKHYLTFRQKNNISAKRSRDALRKKMEDLQIYVACMKEENLQLTHAISYARSQISMLQSLLNLQATKSDFICARSWQ